MLDGNDVITEAQAVLLCIADLFPHLAPPASDLVRRAKLNEVLSELTSEVHPAFGPLFAPPRYAAEPACEESAKRAALARVDACFVRLGFCVESITKILSTLQSNLSAGHPKIPQISGYRMIMPFFSNGFQGAIVGFFFGIDNATAELIRNELMQFGQTLADKWALLRQQSFNLVILNSGDPKQVAEGLLKIVSPVDYIVVDCAGRSAGYRLRREESYFAGYERLRGLETSRLTSKALRLLTV